MAFHCGHTSLARSKRQLLPPQIKLASLLRRLAERALQLVRRLAERALRLAPRAALFALRLVRGRSCYIGFTLYAALFLREKAKWFERRRRARWSPSRRRQSTPPSCPRPARSHCGCC